MSWSSLETSLSRSTLRHCSQTPSQSILTQGQPVPAMTLLRQAPGRVFTKEPMFKSPVRLDLKALRRKRGSVPGPAVLEADALALGHSLKATNQISRAGTTSRLHFPFNRARQCCDDPCCPLPDLRPQRAAVLPSCSLEC